MILTAVDNTRQLLTHEPHNNILLLLQFCCLLKLWTNPKAVTCSYDYPKHLLGENKSQGKRGEFRCTIICSKPGALKHNMANVIITYRERNVDYNWAVKFFATIFQIFSLLFGSMTLGYEIKKVIALIVKPREKKSNKNNNCSANFCLWEIPRLFRMNLVHSRLAREHRDTENRGF